MRRYIFLLFLLILLPFTVFAFESADSRKYMGYSQQILYNSSTILQTSYLGSYVSGDTASTLQILSSNNSFTYNYQVLTPYAVCHQDQTAGMISGDWQNDCLLKEYLNDSSLKYFEQDICVSSTNFKFEVINSGSDDFTSTNNAHYIVTGKKCFLEGDDQQVAPDNIVGPKLWSWLQDEQYHGYVLKLFLPISQWKSVNNNMQAYSFLKITNTGDYTNYYRFITTGGLYDHDRYYEIDNSFYLQTEEFDVTYKAMQNGIDAIDTDATTNYQLSKNLFDVATWVTKGNNSNYYHYSDGKLYIDHLDTRSFANFTEAEKIYLPNGTYYLSNIGSASIRIYPYGNSTDVRTNQFEVTQGYIYLKLLSSSVISIQPQIEAGNFPTLYCPFGPTLDNNCHASYSNSNSISYDSTNIFNNIWNVLNLPLRLSSDVLNGVSGNCSPLVFNVFRHNINVPCGSFFWNRSDVSSFRTIWNLLFGGFIIFKLLVWNIRVLASCFDPTADSVVYGIDLIDANKGKTGD